MEYFKAFNEESVCWLRKCPKRKTARHRGVRAGVIGSKSVTDDDSKGERASGAREALFLLPRLIATLPKMQMPAAVLALFRLPPSELCMNRNNELEKTEVGVARRRSGEGERQAANAKVEELSKIQVLSAHSLTPSGTHTRDQCDDDELP